MLCSSELLTAASDRHLAICDVSADWVTDIDGNVAVCDVTAVLADCDWPLVMVKWLGVMWRLWASSWPFIMLYKIVL